MIRLVLSLILAIAVSFGLGWFFAGNEPARTYAANAITLQFLRSVNRLPKCPSGYVCTPSLDTNPSATVRSPHGTQDL